jgi:hypothetical protein
VFPQTPQNFRSAPSHQHPGPCNVVSQCVRTAVSIALRRGDRLLPGNEEPALGAHLVTLRLAFAHHGIYVGGGNVVHYGAFAHQFRTAPVEEISLPFFAHGHTVFVRPHAAPRFDCAEVIHRARSRLGESSYDLLRNNCEHFCEWCVQGVPCSYQVERVLKYPRALARTVGAVLALVRTNRIFAHLLRVLCVLPEIST